MLRLVLVIGGVLTFAAFLVSALGGIDNADRDARIRMPGEAALQLEPGKYGVFYEEQVETGENETFEPPEGIRIRVRGLGGAPQPELDLGGLGNQIGTDDRTAEEIGTLEVAEAGRYGVLVGAAPRPAPGPAITIGESATDGLVTGAKRAGAAAALTGLAALLLVGLRRLRPRDRGGGSVDGATGAPEAAPNRLRPDQLERLERLGALRESGAISAHEFERLKAALLAG